MFETRALGMHHGLQQVYMLLKFNYLHVIIVNENGGTSQEEIRRSATFK